MTDSSEQLAPHSSVMPFYKAEKIAADFGNQVVELVEYITECKHQRGVPEGPTSTLPVERLKHSKHEIQIALAIVIAEYVVKLAVQPSNQVRGILAAAPTSSAKLELFTRQPIDGRENFVIECASENLYFSWERLCEHCLKETAGELPESVKATPWPSKQALVTYWQAVDRLIPDLLNEPTLVAIRET
jgi:hypothetical protein